MIHVNAHNPPTLFSPTGKKIESKPQLARALGDTIDLSTFDYQAGRVVPSATHMMLQHNALKRKLNTTPIGVGSSSSSAIVAGPTGPSLPPPVPIYNQLPAAGRSHHHHHNQQQQQYDYRYRSRKGPDVVDSVLLPFRFEFGFPRTKLIPIGRTLFRTKGRKFR